MLTDTERNTPDSIPDLGLSFPCLFISFEPVVYYPDLLA
jgi:hypothetical protein